jgi:chromosome segregation ATPase
VAVADSIDGIRRDVAQLQQQVGRVEERLTAHSELSNERNENLQERVATAQQAIIRQVSEMEARMREESQERTKRMQIIIGAVTTVLSALGGGMLVLRPETPASPPPNPPAISAPADLPPGPQPD